MTKIVTRVVRDGEVEYELRCVSFEVEPVYLSPEHGRHVERFTGYPYDAEEDARCRSWAAFKRWDHQKHLARKRAANAP